MKSFYGTAASLQPRILVVDDRLELRQALALALDYFGMEPVLAAGGKEALVQIQRGRVDLILLDIDMPEFSGFDLCRMLKERPATRSIPIIFVTGRGDKAERELAFALGAVDFLVKPFHFPALKEAIHQALKIHCAES